MTMEREVREGARTRATDSRDIALDTSTSKPDPAPDPNLSDRQLLYTCIDHDDRWWNLSTPNHLDRQSVGITRLHSRSCSKYRATNDAGTLSSVACDHDGLLSLSMISARTPS